MGRIVGIDFGTSNSSVAFHDGKSAQIIEMADGSRLLPSVIAFTDDHNVLVGNSAISAGKIAPLNCFRHIKRFMGEDWNRSENTGAQTVEGDDGKTWLKGPDRNYAPAEFAAVIISALLDAAEAKLDERPDGAVIGVPAGYKQPHRAAIKEAARIAGLADDRIWLVEEPTLAAIPYGQGRKKFATIAVYDWGGGTFDFTILRGKGVKLKVVGTRGNARLGGKDVDELIVRHVLKAWKAQYNVDLGLRTDTMPRIREEAEATKIDLTGNPKSAVTVQFVDSTGPDGVRHMNEPITQAEFNEMARATIQSTFGPCQELMADEGVQISDIDEIVLVGGMTRVPLVREMVTEWFKKKPLTKVPPEEAVALGAATYAAQAIERRGGDDEFILENKSAHSLCVETLNDVPFVVIPRGSELPAERKIVLTTAVDGQPVVGLHILEGDEGRASANTMLKRYYPPVAQAPVGEPSEEMTFRIEADGSVVVLHGETLIYEGMAA